MTYVYLYFQSVLFSVLLLPWWSPFVDKEIRNQINNNGYWTKKLFFTRSKFVVDRQVGNLYELLLLNAFFALGVDYGEL